MQVIKPLITSPTILGVSQEFQCFLQIRTFGEGQVGIRSESNGYSGDSVRQKFGAYERDSVTGLDFVQARYYSSVQGRFTSVDPLISSGRPSSPQSWNRYSYVGNHPLELTDPTGLIWARKGDQYKWFEKDIPDGWTAVTEFVFWGGRCWLGCSKSYKK